MVLVFALLDCILSFLFLRLRRKPTDRERAEWLHRSCQKVQRRVKIQAAVEGLPPRAGLIVSNHLSYLDILLYGAAFPCVFVSKSEVRSWPLIGILAKFGGTVFIDRASTASVSQAADQISRLLDAEVPVLLFPEGTSSSGETVLRFHPSLFAPAVLSTAPVTSAAIAYNAAPYAAEKDLCYYGDISFGPHLLKTLMLPRIQGVLRFSAAPKVFTQRKTAASETWREVNEMRALQLKAAAGPGSPS